MFQFGRQRPLQVYISLESFNVTDYVHPDKTINEASANSGRGNFVTPALIRMAKEKVTQMNNNKNIIVQKIMRPFSSLVQVSIISVSSQPSISL